MRVLVIAVVALFAAACGGSFSPIDDGEAGAVREGGAVDRAPDPSDASRGDAARPEAGPSDAAPSSDAAAEAQALDAGPKDAAKVTPDACALAAPEPSICDGITAASYCVQVGDTYSQAPTPPACQCATSYTCACVEELSDPCDGHGKLVGCFMEEGAVPVVQCAS
jgi:hypothetical protein